MTIATPGDGLLSGIRVADFTWAWAGPYASMMLAEMGAEVIKVERPPVANSLRLTPPFVENTPGTNRSGWHQIADKGKLSCAIDLRVANGVELAKRLVAISDVVVENFSPRVMAKIGLDYRSVAETVPNVVYLSMSLFGASGPRSDMIGFGTHMAMLGGLAFATGEADGQPVTALIPYGDPVAGITGAVAVLAALFFRENSGCGQHIDLSDVEAVATLLPELLADYGLNGRIASRNGNRGRTPALQGCYQCRDAGDWVAVAVTNETEWVGLVAALGNPGWCADARAADAPTRWRNQDWIDERLADTIAQYGLDEVCSRLQAAGVPATPSSTIDRLFADPHLVERCFLTSVIHPETGLSVVPSAVWRFANSRTLAAPAPTLGQHNDYVFRDLLGMSTRQIADLVVCGAIPVV